MKERPILFSAPMVNAILEGRKTQTRRVIKPQPLNVIYHNGNWIESQCELSENDHILKCPHGSIGGLLWVRERWAVAECYDAFKPSELVLTRRQVEYYASQGYLGNVRGKWRPSIFMPRWASRINLDMTGIRVARVQDISSQDVEKEGIDVVSKLPLFINPEADMERMVNFVAHDLFSKLWDSINGKKYPWDSNPYVWCIEFKKI
jgi:hypothetical protein